jgi:hypothetical protein
LALGVHHIVGVMLAARTLFALPVALLLAAGCAGATDTELDDQPDPGAASTTNPTEPGKGDDSKTGATPSPGDTKGPNDPKAPGPRTDDPKEPGKEPPAPPAACSVEVEDNNSEAKAVMFSGCMSGKLATKSDADFFKVVAPKGAKTMTIEHKESNGKVLYRVTQENGIPLLGTTMFTEEAPPIEVQGGQIYVFRLTVPMNNQGTTGDRPYEMVVSFE